jgi:hypothetical protein
VIPAQNSCQYPRHRGLPSEERVSIESYPKARIDIVNHRVKGIIGYNEDHRSSS